MDRLVILAPRFSFLAAYTRLFKSLCRSVRQSVGHAVDNEERKDIKGNGLSGDLNII